MDGRKGDCTSVGLYWSLGSAVGCKEPISVFKHKSEMLWFTI